jgi:hypothetical protein
MTKIRKRSILLLGRKTSISLEDEFWEALKEVAESKSYRLLYWWLKSRKRMARVVFHRLCGCLFSSIFAK